MEDEKKYVIYCHTNKINGDKYIGQTAQGNLYNSNNGRWYGEGIRYKKCPYFWNAIQYYKWENFEHEILEDNISEKDIDERERYYIELYKTNIAKYKDEAKGYNLNEGGYGARNIADSTREKQRESHLGKRPSEESLLKMSEAQKGRTFTEESINKMKESADKNAYGNGEKLKLKTRNMRTGQVFESSAEASRFINKNDTAVASAIELGIKCAGDYYEYVGYEDKCRLIRETKDRSIKIINKKYIYYPAQNKTYSNMTEAAKDLNISRSTVKRILNEGKTRCGIYLEYK